MGKANGVEMPNQMHKNLASWASGIWAKIKWPVL